MCCGHAVTAFASFILPHHLSLPFKQKRVDHRLPFPLSPLFLISSFYLLHTSACAVRKATSSCGHCIYYESNFLTKEGNTIHSVAYSAQSFLLSLSLSFSCICFSIRRGRPLSPLEEREKELLRPSRASSFSLYSHVHSLHTHGVA